MLKKLGEGKFSEVYSAIDIKSGLVFALKKVNKNTI
jgi:serine/threonine protein kinase